MSTATPMYSSTHRCNYDKEFALKHITNVYVQYEYMNMNICVQVTSKSVFLR